MRHKLFLAIWGRGVVYSIQEQERGIVKDTISVVEAKISDFIAEVKTLFIEKNFVRAIYVLCIWLLPYLLILQ